MIIRHTNLAIGAVTSALLCANSAGVLVPNGDFSTAAGDLWEEVSDGGTYAFDYPDTGGNPDGHGIIDHTAADGGFGIWVANAGDVITLDSLGLVAGEAYVFSQDMKIISGANIGGFKVDFFTGPDGAGSTGDLYPSLIGDGTTWETYNFTVVIPAVADGIKVVPLWGPDSSVGYDNVEVDPTPVPQPPIPNGDFENGSASWFEIGGDTVWEYPGTGGNPDGFGVMTNGEEGDFAIWVANGGAPLALDSLGLSGGDLVTFVQDMTILSGDNLGGLKIEFLEGATFLGDTGDMRPELIGDGSTWETYSFEVSIPVAADHIKVVPLWGPGSSVGYDNVSFFKPEPPRFPVDIEMGTVLVWETEGENLFHQLQESFDGVEWDDIGPVVLGGASTSQFITSEAPMYRVEVTQLVAADVALNGGFETEGGESPDCAESWICFSPPSSNQSPTRITDDSRTGDASMRIAVINDDTGTPNNSELQHNVADAGGFITVGETYELSFWAKQISSGVSYVQQYRLQWLDEIGVILGGTDFANFAGGDGVWERISVGGLVPPEGASTAFIQIFGATGAVAGEVALGEVLIDDLMLATVSREAFDTIDAIPNPGVRISWDTEADKCYQVEASAADLDGFADFGSPISGDGNRASVSDVKAVEAKYYRVIEKAPSSPPE